MRYYNEFSRIKRQIYQIHIVIKKFQKIANTLFYFAVLFAIIYNWYIILVKVCLFGGASRVYNLLRNETQLY